MFAVLRLRAEPTSDLSKVETLRDAAVMMLRALQQGQDILLLRAYQVASCILAAD